MVNSVTLVGRVGKDPESRMAGETPVASFSLATSEKVKGEEQTQWHQVKVFGKLADIVQQYVKKGQMLYIGGSIRYESWEKDGEKKYRTEIVAREMKMLGGKGE